MERSLFSQKNEPDLAEAALIASGVNTLEELHNYLAKLDVLCHQITLGKGLPDIERAKAIFDWLWRTKPNRYEPRGNFKLTVVIEAQLDDKCERVGNCLGLTVLYNVLAHRFGLRVKAAYLEQVFGTAPHVFSILYINNRAIDVENILPQGFDYQGHRQNLLREEWGNRELVADIYHSIANSLGEQGEWEGAIKNYDKAIKLNPKYTKAYLNKGIALAHIGKAKEAEDIFNQGGSLWR